ncbi:asparaginase [Sistotremastrum niveocremeum HHB9708]|uniref:Asparaginase n=1 Tax=Sistotremastrum niveocremeum HHB9708 TaxID=1314777 RepID=A0A165A2P6_9AGAM|nr:asparaginase [Sistotremastrum niveocremeum HHB9708]
MSLSEKRPLLPSNLKKKGTKPVLVIHGGAGTLDRSRLTPELRVKYIAALEQALLAGNEVLTNGGEALDAVVAAVTVLEDCPLFNSGKGAVFNSAGKNELEASVMLSRPPSNRPDILPTRRGLGVTLITRAKNPSHLVRALYLAPESIHHAFLSGAYPEDFAASRGETLVDPSYFWTEARWREHRRGLGLPEDPLPYPSTTDSSDAPLDQLPKGTVGAVALDAQGCIACLTSTGGLTNKLPGRVGDTPTMGTGFWAEEWKPTGPLARLWRKLTRKPLRVAVGVSGTGDGDYFIRLNAASTVAHRMKYLGESLEKATSAVVEDLKLNGGLGGLIAVNQDGQVALPLNCSGMYRGVIRTDGVPKTAIFDDEILA